MAKSPNAFRTISEASEEIGAPQHVLRFWETKFDFIAPLKRAGGRRFYRPQDIVLLKSVRRLLHDEGLTIKGVQRLHREQGLRRIAAYGDPDGEVALGVESQPRSAAERSTGGTRLHQALAELEGARARLEAVLTRAG